VFDPSALSIVAATRDAIAETVGPPLIGIYVYGSLATGDFEPHVSDLDLIAVLTETPDEPLVAHLGPMHERLARANPEWVDRIEVDYVAVDGLGHCQTRSTTIARISPGEPLHLLEAGRDFLLDWYPARRDAVGLLGPPIDLLIPEISEAEYLDELRGYLAGFLERFDEDASAGSQSYAVLTMCRGLFLLRDRERLSKREAARRASIEFPRWAPVIGSAVAWRDAVRKEGLRDDASALPRTRAFVSEMAHLLDLPVE
jgi:predicted nucleotidyltransferase